jgi:hypothetical protein
MLFVCIYLSGTIVPTDRMRNEEIRKIVRTTPVNEYIEKQESQLVWSFNENDPKLVCIKSVQYEIRNKRKTKKKMD